MRHCTVPLSRIAGLVLCSAMAATQAQPREAPATNAELASILEALAGSADRESHRQVVDAIAASPTLTRDLGDLATNHALTGIDVLPPTGSGNAVRGPFGAAVDGSHLVLSTTLTTALRNNRNFDVAQPNEVLPNNTVFVLAHLAYHLAHPVGKPDPGEALPRWIARRLADEASAYIASWNATVEEATLRSGSATLSGPQVASLLLNCRYRFAFLGGRNGGPAGPTWTPSGSLEASPANVAAIVATLERASLADLE